MAKNHVIRTARLTDRQILEIQFALKERKDLKVSSISLGPGLDFDILPMEKNHERIILLTSDRHAILQADTRTKSGIEILFLRGICENVDTPQQNRQGSPYFDEVYLSSSSNRSETNIRDIIECMGIIEDTLPTTFPLHTAKKGQDLIDIVQVEIVSLADQNRKMLSDLAKERSEFRKADDKQRRAREKEHEYAKSQVESELEEQKKEFDDYKTREESGLQQRKINLDEREQDLDNRHHMHARRKLREQITKNFKKRMCEPIISKRASVMRWLVFGLTIAAGLGTGYFAVTSFEDLSFYHRSSPSFDWLSISLVLRGIVSVFLSVGFIVYAINWLRVVYLDDVRTERRYESYGNDIDRASFIIETIMEVGETEKTAVPDTWIDGVCRNLFSDIEGDNYGHVPSNAAAMLFESISGAKFGSEGTEVTMNRRDARKFAKKLDND